MFYFKSPREYIEGFNDPLVSLLATTPVYMGGDSTNSPFMAINSAPTSPPNIMLGLFTGSDNYIMTRMISSWFERDYVTVRRKDYEDIYNLKTIYANPWG